MGTPNSSTSTPYRPSCRGIRSNSSRARRKRPRKRSDLEPRRRKAISGVSSAPAEGATGRAMVVGPYLRRRPLRAQPQAVDTERSPDARLEEAVGLARAIDLDIVGQGLAPPNDIRRATSPGKGKV